MAYAILVTRPKDKCKKSKMRSLKVKDAHINRDENFKDIATHADPSLKHLNQHLIGNGDIYNAVKTAIDPIKYRSNQVGINEPVVSYDLLLTASPEYFYKTNSENKCTYIKRDDYDQRLTDWTEKAKAYLEKNHYCVGATLHLDETTPHIHATAIPFEKINGVYDTTKTNAKKVMYYKKFQNDYFKEVGLPLGLERGIENSKAEHQEVKTFYKDIAKRKAKYDLDIQEPTAKVERRIGRIETSATVETKSFFSNGTKIIARPNETIKGEALSISKYTIQEMAMGYATKTANLESQLRKSNVTISKNKTQIQHLQAQEKELVALKIKQQKTVANHQALKAINALHFGFIQHEMNNLASVAEMEKYKNRFAEFANAEKARIADQQKPMPAPKAIETNSKAVQQARERARGISF